MEFKAWLFTSLSAEYENIVQNFWVENLEQKIRSKQYL